MILAKTVKGWTLGAGVEARNITHQAKKLSETELKVFRDRLELPIPDDQLKDAPYFHPGPDSEEVQYLQERRKLLGGPLPRRVVRSQPLPKPEAAVDAEFASGSTTAVSTTMVFARILRNLIRDPNVGKRIVPIIPDEARTFGMDPLFKEVGIYAANGQRYEPVDSELVLSYREAQDGQVLEEGINEAGSMASLSAAGTSYATHGEPMIPFYIFYSMFGFQRTGDQTWAFGDQRGRGFMIGATAGRTTLTGEGLQHDDGHSHILASTVPVVRAYDPAFAYELAGVIRDGIERMYHDGEDVFYYVTVYNENYPQPPKPDGVDEGIIRGIYRFDAAPDVRRREGRGCASSARGRSCSRSSRPATCSRTSSGSRPRSTRRRRSSSSATRRSRSSAGTASTPTRPRRCRTSARCSDPTVARSSSRPTGSGRCPTWSRRGSRTRTSCSARTASAGATPARACVRTSRSTRRTSRPRPSPGWPAAAASTPARRRSRSARWASIPRRPTR